MMLFFVVIGYIVLLIIMLEISLWRLYRIAYALAPEDQRKNCDLYPLVRNPWNNTFCENTHLKHFSRMCFKIYVGANIFGLLVPAFCIIFFGSGFGPQ